MSDIKLFRTNGASVIELEGHSVSLEKSLQTLIETYDVHAVQQINRNIELLRYVRFGTDLLILELVNAVVASIDAGKLIVTVEKLSRNTRIKRSRNNWPKLVQT